MTNKKEDLTQLSVKELREVVVKLGMPENDAENFETKKSLIATINTLRAQKAIDTPGQLKRDKEQYLSKAEIMRAHLMKQSRVRILVPLQGEEKPGVIKLVYNKQTKREEQVYISGAYLPVQLNGFKWLVAKGRYEEVPQQIADAISESQSMTAEAGRAWLIDRKDPETGQPVRDKLEY